MIPSPDHRPDVDRVRRARVALAVVFFVNGAVFGHWVSRIPDIKDRVDAGTGPLGIALLGIAAGALLAKQGAGQWVARFGSAPVARVGVAATCSALVLPALPSRVVPLGFALVAFGAAMGVLDIAMNAHAVAVQERGGRPILSSLHGAYSVGGLAGALLGGRIAASELEPALHFAAVAVVLGGAALAASAGLLRADPNPESRSTRAGWTRLAPGRRFPVFLLGAVGFCGMAGEGAAADWSAIYLRDDLGATPGLAACGYAAYSIAMVVGRLTGDFAVAQWGELRVLMASLTFAGAIFGVALWVGQSAAAMFGFAALGLGLSVVVPVVFSTAGRMAGDAAGPAITVVSSLSGAGFFAGPPVIGYLAEAIGLAHALWAISALTFAAVLVLRVVKARRAPDVAFRPVESLR